MQIDYDIILQLLTWAIVFLCIYFLLYKKYILSIFDPLFMHVYITAFSSILIIYAVPELKFKVHYFSCQLALFFGFWLTQPAHSSSKKKDFQFNDRGILAVTLYILLIVYLLSNLFTLYARGFAFFSDDPYARETNFENGFGIFRRVNWGIGSFICAGITILYLTKPKRIYIILIIFIAFLTALEGTKSSLLRIAIIIAALIYHPLFIEKKESIQKLKKFAPIGIVAVIGVALFLLTKESQDDIILSLIRRLIYGADVVLYYYLPQNQYLQTAYTPIDFLAYIVNPITGFLHLTSYTEPFGSVMVSNTRTELLKSNVYLAPNTPFYIEGQIFFGYYGAFIYSFFIGVVFSIIRRLFLTIVKGSYFALALFCTFLFHSSNILIETNYFVTTCFNTCLFVLPVYVVVSFVLRNSWVINKVKFIN